MASFNWMAYEIERKFLVKGEPWIGHAGTAVLQCYLARGRADSPGVRLRIAGDQATLTLKGKASGFTRHEFEYPIPLAEAQAMIDAFPGLPSLEKTRYRIPFDRDLWEVDVFSGPHQGLAIAEIELKSENQKFPHPPWLGREVTGDPRFSNASLASAALPLQVS